MGTTKRAPKLRKYEYLNNFQDGVSFKEQVFIYVLMLNLDDGVPSKPYYVGQADNLHARFVKHDHIDWHYRTFSRPTKIWVAGKVPRSEVLQAEQDLITRLALAGYWLSNVQIDDALARQEQRVQDIRQKQVQEIKQYLYTHKSNDSVAVDWANKWLTESGTPIQRVQATANQSVRKQQRRRILKNDLVKYIESREDISEIAAVVLIRIANAYTPRTRTATVWLSPVEVEDLKSLEGKMPHFFRSENKLTYIPHVKHSFTLGDRMQTAILTSFRTLNATPSKKQAALSVRSMHVTEDQRELENLMISRKRTIEEDARKKITKDELRKGLSTAKFTEQAQVLHKKIIENWKQDEQVSTVFLFRNIDTSSKQSEDLELAGTYLELKGFWKTHREIKTGGKIFFHLTGRAKNLILKEREKRIIERLKTGEYLLPPIGDD